MSHQLYSHLHQTRYQIKKRTIADSFLLIIIETKT